MSISIDSNVEFDVLIGFTHRFLLFYLRGVISLFFFLVSPSNLVIGISFKDTYLSLTQRGKSLTLSLTWRTIHIIHRSDFICTTF